MTIYYNDNQELTIPFNQDSDNISGTLTISLNQDLNNSPTSFTAKLNQDLSNITNALTVKFNQDGNNEHEARQKAARWAVFFASSYILAELRSLVAQSVDKNISVEENDLFNNDKVSEISSYIEKYLNEVQKHISEHRNDNRTFNQLSLNGMQDLADLMQTTQEFQANETGDPLDQQNYSLTTCEEITAIEHQNKEVFNEIIVEVLKGIAVIGIGLLVAAIGVALSLGTGTLFVPVVIFALGFGAVSLGIESIKDATPRDAVRNLTEKENSAIYSLKGKAQRFFTPPEDDKLVDDKSYGNKESEFPAVNYL